MTVRFDGRVVIVTGAGGGLGREHALQYAERGAKVLVNDLGGALDGQGGSAKPADAVVEQITASGGEALASYASVTDHEQVLAMVDQAMTRWGRVDVLVNNAGILRDTSFTNLTPDTLRSVVDVHLLGSAYCCLAAWPHMKRAGYGRIVMTSSASGVYGNFGQSNYAAAKMGVVGLMNVLTLEGQKYDIRVNTIVPAALTRMTEKLTPAPIQALMQARAVSPAVLFLSGEDAPARVILAAGCGGYSRVYVLETEGIFLPPEQRSPEEIRQRFAEICSRDTLHEYRDVGGGTLKFLRKAAAHAGVDLRLG